MWQLRGVGRLLAKGFAAGGVLSIVLCGSTVAHVDRLDVDDDGTGCDGTALFVDGTEADGSFTIVASDVGDETIVVPRADTVEWTGSVDAAPGEYEGWIAVDLPAPFGTVTIDTWSGDSATTSNSGVEDYDLPWLVPSGVDVTIRGQHQDENGTCTGTVTVEIEGGPFDTPIAPISLGVTVVSGAGLLAMLRPLFRGGVGAMKGGV